MVQSTGLKKVKCSVFISGKGSNLKSLIQFTKKENSPISIELIISDNPKAKGLKFGNIFKWLKKNGVSEKEMLKTFNCGVGFCLIINPKDLKKVTKHFSSHYKPYVIGKISRGSNKVKLNGSINWY